MKAKRRRHESEFKARVALKALKGVQTIQQIAKDFDIHPMQVTEWKKAMSSWLEFAPDATFAGFTLAEVEEGSMEPFEIRKTMEAAKTKLTGLKLKRDKAEEKLNDMLV